VFIEIEGLRIYYEVAGRGKPVVLLHGWGGRVESFRPVFNFLRPRFKVYALDLPGFGRSDEPPVPWDVGEYTAVVADFFTELGLEKADVVAHSFGGRVALVLAAVFPDRVDKLVLIDSAGIKPKRTLSYHLRVAVAKAVRSLSVFGRGGRKVKEALYALTGSRDYRQTEGVMRATFVRVVNEDLRPLLPSIKAPTLLIWGEKDTDTPLSDGQIMEQEIADAGLVVLKNAGHFSYLDAFPQFCRIVSVFLGGD
jgi:pimeloyl-ACP methyl ester carboxylesterase